LRLNLNVEVFKPAKAKGISNTVKLRLNLNVEVFNTEEH